MAAFRTNDGRFHTADTAADHRDLLRLLGGLDMVFLGLHRFGIQSTACQSHSIGQILGVGVSLGGGEVKASGMTADAGLDVLETVLNQFGDPFRIGQELTCYTDGVDPTVCNGFCTDFRIHSTGANHGNVYEFFNMRHIVQVAVLGHIHRRMRPVPGIVCTVVRVQHIVARILQIAGGTLGFLHTAAHLGIFLAGHSTLAESLHL